MRSSRYAMPLFIAVLSLGSLAQWGNSPVSDQRHISSCEDPALKPASAALPTALFSFVQSDSARQATEAYTLWMQAMQVNAQLFSLTKPSMYGFPVPLFPSYAMPTDHYIDPRNLAQPTLAWGGLMADPKLQYLIKPAASTAMNATPGSLDAMVNLPIYQSNATIGFSIGSNIVAAPVAGPSNLGSISQELAKQSTFSSKL
jgi:hypothetical protein